MKKLIKIIKKVLGLNRDKTFHWVETKKDNKMVQLMCCYTQTDAKGGKHRVMEVLAERVSMVDITKREIIKTLKNVVEGGAWEPIENAKCELLGNYKFRMDEKYKRNIS
jgi:hypothetical protein